MHIGKCRCKALPPELSPHELALLTFADVMAPWWDGTCDLTDALGLSQPTVSHHLKKLREAGLVFAQRRQGPWTYYRVVPDALTGLAHVISPHGSSAASC